jgi:hypothetical protein
MALAPTSIMLKKTRPDGTYLDDLPHFTRLLPYLMPSRTDASIFIEQEIDVTHTREFVQAANRGDEGSARRITFFQVCLCAAVRTLALRPRLNRFVSGYNYYQRHQIVATFVAKRELSDDGGEINVTLPFQADETLSTLPAKVSQFIQRAKAGQSNASDRLNALLVKLPRWLIRLSIWLLRFLDFHNLLPGSFMRSMPFWSSMFFTNVGSVGMDAPFHHHFNLGTCGLFIALGKHRGELVLTDDGRSVCRDKMKVAFTHDDRVVDALYAGRALELFRSLVENPERLEQPPESPAFDPPAE